VSLRRRLALLSAAAVALAVVLASVMVYALVRDRLRDQVDDDLRGQADMALSRLEGVFTRALSPAGAVPPGALGGIIARAEAPPGPGGPPGVTPPGGGAVSDGAAVKKHRPPDQLLALPPPDPGSMPALGQIIGADGTAVQTPGTPIQIPVSSEAREVAGGGTEPRLEDVHLDGNTNLRVLTQPLVNGAALQVASSLKDTEDTLSSLVVILFLVSAGGVALAAALGPVVARTALAPAGEVSDAAEEVARTHDLTRRIEVRGGDELGRLSASFNEMMEALERSESAQRRLVADASHELRTPLATLRTNIETLGRREQMDPSERERLVADLTDELEEMTELVADVVELARLPGRDGGAVEEDVALDELARDAVERARRRSRGLRFDGRFAPSLVRGDRQRLGRAISNMLDNARKWSPPEGVVEVEVGDGRVAVRDHGPGFAGDDLPKVFDRFWRADEARGKPGSGLGLAIVQRVAEEHGGTATAANAEGGGAVVSIELPSERPDPEATS
jgi:two-component system, OmpR family, sensor histidine kinase MprB